MNEQDKINALRIKIDKIDNEIVQLFNKRLELANKIASEKIKYNLSIEDTKRENEILKKFEKQENFIHIKKLYQSIFDITKKYEE
ncbi:MAG: chorismate mutase [Clostridia bacterium]|nr:chorismate mutase [Clostridia bacterium]